MSNQNLFEKVEKALSCDDWATAKILLEQVDENEDIDVKIYRGTVLSLSSEIDSYHEGVLLLRGLAENGNGHAAHNLATALVSGIGATKKNRSEVSYFMQIAVDSGFEKTVSNNPFWWKEAT